MGMFDLFKTDEALEQNGLALDYGDFRVTIARAGGANKRYQQTLERKTRPYRRAIQTDTFPTDRAEEILRETYAECVVRNWEVKRDDDQWVEGIEQTDGSLAPVTKENVLKVFDELPDLFDDIREQASRAALFRAAARELAAGNS